MSGIISDQALLEIENLRIRLRNVLRSFNVIVADDATLNEITSLYETKLGFDVNTIYLETGSQSKYINNSIISLGYSVPISINKVKMEKLTSINGLCLGSNIRNIYFPVLDSTSGIISTGSNLKNIILPNWTISGSNQPFTTAILLERLITPKLINFNYYYNFPVLNIIDTLNGVPINPVNSLHYLIIRNNTLVALNNSTNFTNIQEIYVPQDLLNSYKTATNWSVYADKIFALEGSNYEDEDWYENTQWYEEEMAVWQ